MEVMQQMSEETKEPGCLGWCIICGVAGLAYWLISLLLNATGKSPADTQRIMSRVAIVLAAVFVPWLIKVWNGGK